MSTGLKANSDGSAAIQVGGTDVIGLGSTGNINFPVSGQRITGDFSNATLANRVIFQTSTVNGNTGLGVITNGTGNSTGMRFFNASDITNAGALFVGSGTNDAFIQSVITGTGTYLPMTFFTGGTEQARITTAGLFQFNSGYGSVATAYGCRAWVNFNGAANTNLSGTYSQSGTTVTVTATAHGLIAGNVVYSDITTGTAVDGTYTVATVTDANTFTYTAGTSLTTSGNITLIRSTIRASGNVSSVADNGTGNYTVNFTTAMSDSNYNAVFGNMISGRSACASEAQSGTRTTTALQVWSIEPPTGALQDPTVMSVSIFR